MKHIIKVCGMTEGENIRDVEALGIDLIGFIFYEKSPRYVRQRPSYLPIHAGRVGVFVDASLDVITKRAEEFGLTHIQLHGHESLEQCQALQKASFKVIKAFHIAELSDLKATEAYQGVCDYFLFDTKTPSYGGSGKAFNWDLLSHYQGPTPFLLSGGIGLESIKALKQFHHPALAGYDLNSRFEITPGIKDVAKIKLFNSQLTIDN